MTQISDEEIEQIMHKLEKQVEVGLFGMADGESVSFKECLQVITQFRGRVKAAEKELCK